jgi:hypothetical protein
MEDFDPVEAWNEALFKEMMKTPLESIAARSTMPRQREWDWRLLRTEHSIPTYAP